MGGAGWAGGQPLTVVVVIVVKNQVRMILVDLTPARNTAVREASVAAQPWPATREAARVAPADPFFNWLSVEFKQGVIFFKVR